MLSRKTIDMVTKNSFFIVPSCYEFLDMNQEPLTAF